MPIEDVKSLVKHERETETEFHKVRKDVARILEKPKVETKRIWKTHYFFFFLPFFALTISHFSKEPPRSYYI